MFYLFSSILLIATVCTITVKNPVHSVLFLIVVYCNAAGLLIMQGAEFLALIITIVYMGAIAVLFLFIVMMLNVKTETTTQDLLKYLPIVGILGFVFFWEISSAIETEGTICFLNSNVGAWNQWLDNLGNIELFGQVLYTQYTLAIILAGFILLVAMIGSIQLTLESVEGVYRQQTYQQISRHLENAVFLIDHKTN